jgi:hypothetical protein
MFSYSTGDSYVSLLKTSTSAPIVTRSETAMIIADPYQSLLGGGMWSYMIDVSTKEIVAVELNIGIQSGHT